MINWKNNAVMFWDGNKITDHGRDVLSQTTERIGTDVRMANGTLRRYSVAKKRQWTSSWTNLPSTNSVATGFKTADGGFSGEQMEDFYATRNDAFRMILRRGSAEGKTPPTVTDAQLPYQDADFYICKVMLTEFTKDVVKRGKVDLWNISVTLEEV